MSAREQAEAMTTRELLNCIRDALSDLHEPPGTPNGEPRDDCPGCQTQAMVAVLASRWLK